MGMIQRKTWLTRYSSLDKKYNTGKNECNGSEGMSSTEGEVLRVLDEMIQVQTIYYG